MVFHNFDELIARVKDQPNRARMAAATTGDAHTIEAVLHARAEGIVTPILVSDRAVIDQVLAELGEHIPAEGIRDEPDLTETARKAVALVRVGEAGFLMRGKLDISMLPKAVVNKETGLGKDSVMSHFTAFEIPTCHKLLMPVGGGMVTYSTLEQKRAIIENTVGAPRAMGYDCPKADVLACVEKLSPKMPEVMEGDTLKQMNRRGELTGCMVEGPISYDYAVSRGIAAFKDFESPCAGDCDMLVAPNIHAGNIMGKMLIITCRAKIAGSIVGARCPIVVTDRSSSVGEKYLSIVISAAAARNQQGGTPMERLLVLSPGSMSTKLIVSNGEEPLFVESITHSTEELAPFDCVTDQYEFRHKLVLGCPKRHSVPLDSLTTIISRDGLLTPIEAGAYGVNDDMVWQLKNKPQNKHASNVNTMTARSISLQLDIPAYIYDGVTVDELLPINKLTSLPSMRRKSMDHNLDTRAVALRCARENGRDYKGVTVIVTRLGGDISINLHHNGKIEDFINNGEGPFSPEWASGLPMFDMIKECFGGRCDYKGTAKLVKNQGGLMAHLGTTDSRAAEQMIQSGDTHTKLVYDAMILSITKNIAKCALSVCGKVGVTLLTDGITYSQYVTSEAEKRASFLAPVVVYSGEDEMRSLALGGPRVLRG